MQLIRSDLAARARAQSSMNTKDALFHYTSADGLLGILSRGQLWCTAYIGSNDESELTFGHGLIASLLTGGDSADLVKDRLRRDPNVVAHEFETDIVSVLGSNITTYSAFFRTTSSERVYLDGLLSQWRAYGGDAGYAIQFSRSALLEWLQGEGAKQPQNLLKEVSYERANEYRNEVVVHASGLLTLFAKYIEYLADTDTPLPLARIEAIDAAVFSDIQEEEVKAIQAYLVYLRYTKDSAFQEEKEVRLSILDMFPRRDASERKVLPKAFIRDGTVMSYRPIPHVANKNLLKAISAIIVGPSADSGKRAHALVHYVIANDLTSIDVRRSAIPLV